MPVSASNFFEIAERACGCSYQGQPNTHAPDKPANLKIEEQYHSKVKELLAQMAVRMDLSPNLGVFRFDPRKGRDVLDQFAIDTWERAYLEAPPGVLSTSLHPLLFIANAYSTILGIRAKDCLRSDECASLQAETRTSMHERYVVAQYIAPTDLAETIDGGIFHACYVVAQYLIAATEVCIQRSTVCEENFNRYITEIEPVIVRQSKTRLDIDAYVETNMNCLSTDQLIFTFADNDLNPKLLWNENHLSYAMYIDPSLFNPLLKVTVPRIRQRINQPRYGCPAASVLLQKTSLVKVIRNSVVQLITDWLFKRGGWDACKRFSASNNMRRFI